MITKKELIKLLEDYPDGAIIGVQSETDIFQEIYDDTADCVARDIDGIVLGENINAKHGVICLVSDERHGLDVKGKLKSKEIL